MPGGPLRTLSAGPRLTEDSSRFASAAPLVVTIGFPPAVIVGYSLYDERTTYLNAAPLTVNLSSNVDGGAAPYTYAWDFGDGSATVATPSASHVFRFPGYYLVHLTVSDSTSEESIAWAGVSVYPGSSPFGVGPPQPYSVLVAVGDSTIGLTPLLLHYGVNGYGGPGGPTTYATELRFDFGDGTPDNVTTGRSASATFANATHTYSAPGEYILSLNATESVGGAPVSSVSKMTVYVTSPGGPPVLLPDLGSEGGSLGCGPSTVTREFEGSLLGAPGTYQSVWSFGDGTPPAVGNPVTHAYRSPAVASSDATVSYLAILSPNLTMTTQQLALQAPTGCAAASPASAWWDGTAGWLVVAVAGDLVLGVGFAFQLYRPRPPAAAVATDRPGA